MNAEYFLCFYSYWKQSEYSFPAIQNSLRNKKFPNIFCCFLHVLLQLVNVTCYVKIMFHMYTFASCSHSWKCVFRYLLSTLLEKKEEGQRLDAERVKRLRDFLGVADGSLDSNNTSTLAFLYIYLSLFGSG